VLTLENPFKISETFQKNQKPVKNLKGFSSAAAKIFIKTQKKQKYFKFFNQNRS
jgi:hypothetical protein